MTAIERLFCCSPHGSAVLPPLAQAWDQLKLGPQRWLEAGATIQDLAPNGERLLLLSGGAELVDWAQAVAAWTPNRTSSSVGARSSLSLRPQSNLDTEQ